MYLKELIKSLTFHSEIKLPVDFLVKGLSCDSRQTGADFVFVAVKGAKEDGSRFIAEAIKNGARAVVLKSQVITQKRIPTPPIASGARLHVFNLIN